LLDLEAGVAGDFLLPLTLMPREAI